MVKSTADNIKEFNKVHHLEVIKPFKNNGIFHEVLNRSVRIVNCIYIDEFQVTISKKYYISFSEDRFCHSKQCRPLLNSTLCCRAFRMLVLYRTQK